MPNVTIRAPGRVNLIGEHTDYMHLPVLPMAIQRGLTIRATVTDKPGLVAHSTSRQSPVVVDRVTPPASGWDRYLIGAVRQLGEEAAGRGAELHIDGDLPDTGGLSSSSALTTGVLRALATLWELGLDDEEVVRRAIEAERIVGVESGGMDQTVIMFATAGAALRIDWDPPRRTAVRIPETLRFVIGYSGEEAPKGDSVRDEYNERVVSCRAAALLLQRSTGIGAGSPPRLRPFRDIDLASAGLPQTASALDVAVSLGVDVEVLVGLTGGRFQPDRPLRIARAAEHVLSEALRVDAAEEAIRSGDLGGLGVCFDASHGSLQRYGVSTAGLDGVTAAAREAGAAGSRLTGAGFGGWAVAVCGPDQVEAVAEAMGASGAGSAFEVVAAAGIE